MVKNRNIRLGRHIQKLRKRAGLTQEKLAESIGISTTEIGYIELGKHFPRPENLKKIAKALGTKVSDLFPF